MVEHELWVEELETCTEHTFCLAGSAGDGVRATLGPASRRIWTVRAASYAEAMQQYYAFMDWGDSPVIHEADREPYSTKAPMDVNATRSGIDT